VVGSGDPGISRRKPENEGKRPQGTQSV
jgi:hypothetical protein